MFQVSNSARKGKRKSIFGGGCSQLEERGGSRSRVLYLVGAEKGVREIVYAFAFPAVHYSSFFHKK